MRRTLIFLFAASIMLAGCSKTNENAEAKLKGTWIREGTDGSGAANTLHFTEENGVNTLSFDCSGSPGPNWPSHAETEYRFQNNLLSYRNYYDNSLGFYEVTSFKWITEGQVFEVEARQILLYMSAIYTVRYKKIH